MESGTSIPVTGAALTLYEAGTAYGSGATSLGTATSDGSGDFTISYTPPSPAGELYVVALGGASSSDINSAIGLMGVLGLSSAVPGFVTVNELTTVAGEWALAQFTDSSGTIIGAPSTNTTGFENAASLAQADLADIGSGGPAAFWTTYGINSGSCSDSAPVNCDGLERMNTFANILASCVETGSPLSTACTTLCGATSNSTTTTQAAHYLAANPGLTTYISTLFALQNGGSPFTPDLSSAPDGWELALNFYPSGSDFDAPTGIAIDASGNAWVANGLGGFGFDGSVTELNSSGGLVGEFENLNTTGANFDQPQSIAIDASGNAWMPNLSGDSVTELASGGTLVGNYNNTNIIDAGLDGPYAIAIDASGNAWVTNNVGNSVTELSSGGLSSATMIQAPTWTVHTASPLMPLATPGSRTISVRA